MHQIFVDIENHWKWSLDGQHIEDNKTCCPGKGVAARSFVTLIFGRDANRIEQASGSSYPEEIESSRVNVRSEMPFTAYLDTMLIHAFTCINHFGFWSLLAHSPRIIRGAHSNNDLS